MEKITAEPMYFRMIEEDGTLSFVIGPKDGAPDSPRLLFDGKETAVLYRRPGQAIALTKLDELAVSVLSAAKPVMFVEPKSSGASTMKEAATSGQVEYAVPVQIVKKLPVAEENLQADEAANPFRGKTPEEIGDFINKVSELRAEG